MANPKATARITPKQFAWNISIGSAIEMHFADANAEDYQLADLTLQVGAENTAEHDLGLSVPLAKKHTMSSDALTTEEWNLAFREIDLTQYHEAGHAVAYYIHGFHPKRITGALAEHDRRSTPFFRTRNGLLETPSARERVQDYAVCCIAGIVAESKFGGVPVADLRQTSGRGDYETVHAILDRLMIRRGFELCLEVRAAQIQFWESRAVALMDQPDVWAAVESVSAELQMSCGELERGELVAAIERGMYEGPEAWNTAASAPVTDALLVNGSIGEIEDMAVSTSGFNG